MSKTKIWQCVASGVMCLAILVSPALLGGQGTPTILKPADMAKILPATVFYCGQSATTQLRNSGGIKFADGHLVWASLVDTSGYSTGVAAKYQAYFVTEIPIKVSGKNLAAGVYGIGFVDGDDLVVTDVGAHDVLTVSSASDQNLKRPMPLQVLANEGGGFRLYSGRRYVTLSR